MNKNFLLRTLKEPEQAKGKHSLSVVFVGEHQPDHQHVAGHADDERDHIGDDERKEVGVLQPGLCGGREKEGF